MDPGRTWAIARKEFIHIRRDPHSLIMIMLLPVIQLLLYGYALTFNIKDVPVVVCNRDQGHLAEKFLNEFRGSPYFNLKLSAASGEAIDRLLAARAQQPEQAPNLTPPTLSWVMSRASAAISIRRCWGSG